MPSSNVNAGINGVRTPKAAYTTLSIDDDAALLLGKTDGLRPVRQSRSTLKRLFPNLDNGAKEEFSHEAGGNWPRTERYLLLVPDLFLWCTARHASMTRAEGSVADSLQAEVPRAAVCGRAACPISNRKPGHSATAATVVVVLRGRWCPPHAVSLIIALSTKTSTYSAQLILSTYCLGYRWCPEEQAGWFSKLFFIFANSLVSLGSRKHLEQSDLWDTAHQDDPRQLWEQYSQQLEVTADDDAPQVG
eukprot:GHUV01024544.1.p1 GENE.GHUV01024544.1~~GHUV01024544.1.p1  ORF type:complete len:247 (+),score=33.23 GHUV01024544.1:288-1028(+)